MLYIGLVKITSENITKIAEKEKKLWSEREKSPEKYPKKLYLQDGTSVDFVMGKNGMSKAFCLYDTDDPDQLLNLQTFWLPEVRFTFLPIFHTSKFVEAIE
jgi:hypothetical protein